VPRARNRANVNHSFDAVRLQDLNELLDRPCGVPDREYSEFLRVVTFRHGRLVHHIPGYGRDILLFFSNRRGIRIMEAVALGLPGPSAGVRRSERRADNHADEAAWLR